MKTRFSLALVFVGITLVLTALIFVACNSTVEYVRFRMRGQHYYAQLGEAFDQVLAKQDGELPAKMTGSKLEGLPPLLRELRPSFVIVDTNCVTMLIGGGFDSYNLLWVPKKDGEDRFPCELRVYREGIGTRTVFQKVISGH